MCGQRVGRVAGAGAQAGALGHDSALFPPGLATAISPGPTMPHFLFLWGGPRGGPWLVECGQQCPPQWIKQWGQRVTGERSGDIRTPGPRHTEDKVCVLLVYV